MNYRALKQDEHIYFAGLHMDAFQSFFLSTLGEKFLDAYYKAVLKSKETIAVCAVDDNSQLQGFATGCTYSKGYHKRLILRNLTAFFYIALIILFTKPKALIRILMNLDKIASNNDDGNYAELISIGVCQSSKGNGAGKDLVKTFEDEAKRRGCNKISLTTDYINNNDVISFYTKCGYKVFYEFTTYPKRKMYKFIKHLE